jgi:hypothetical protein
MPRSALHRPRALLPPDSDPPPSFSVEVPHNKPICVARKMHGKRMSNIFLDDRGFPYQSHEFDIIQHSSPPLDDVDPRFEPHYDKARHGEGLRSELDFSHLVPPICNHGNSLLQKYWSVFDDKGLFIPVKDYKCFIDMGSTRTICVKKIKYDPWEIDPL